MMVLMIVCEAHVLVSNRKCINIQMWNPPTYHKHGHHLISLQKHIHLSGQAFQGAYESLFMSIYWVPFPYLCSTTSQSFVSQTLNKNRPFWKRGHALNTYYRMELLMRKTKQKWQATLSRCVCKSGKDKLHYWGVAKQRHFTGLDFENRPKHRKELWDSLCKERGLLRRCLANSKHKLMFSWQRKC